jgi:hypothetical protein
MRRGRWRGPEQEGDFPSLGPEIAVWIEDHVVIPDGYRRGDRYLLTNEMLRFLKHFYRVDPEENRLHYYGAQFRRSQKFGKDPFGAAIILAEALGPARFDRWDASGEPAGAPYPTPYIPCLGTSEEQTDNTYLPLLDMIRLGPLADLPGMDAGETRVRLPNGGTIEPVTASARARLGQRMTFATLTESHLWTLQGGYRKLAGAVKRNIAGMDGRWLELTNAWDPTEGSEAQVTAESKNTRVLLDTVEPRRVDDLADNEDLYRELLRQYGDSARERGGWVNIAGRIMHEVRDVAHLEADRRRFFLNEIVVGESVFVDPVRFDLQARPDEVLAPGEKVALGFDGSKYRDATALLASRRSDARLFEVAIWERPPDAGRDWKVPSAEVDRVVCETFGAYDVAVMFADPWRWQDYLDAWAAKFGSGRVVEFPTNQEQRMDAAIERFVTSFTGLEITWRGSPAMARHFKNAVLVKGGRKKPRPGEEQSLATHYLKMAKRGDGMLIDGAVAGVLAHEARAWAAEHTAAAPSPFAMWG